jgi:hypothetical protein
VGATPQKGIDDSSPLSIWWIALDGLVIDLRHGFW